MVHPILCDKADQPENISRRVKRELVSCRKLDSGVLGSNLCLVIKIHWRTASVKTLLKYFAYLKNPIRSPQLDVPVWHISKTNDEVSAD